MKAEVVQGGAGNIEVTGAKVARTKWRQYVSISVSHDDATSRVMFLHRVIQDDTLGFPILPFATSELLPAAISFPARMVTVPPDGRLGAFVGGIAAGAELVLVGLFIEYDVGEPSGDVS